MATSILYLLPKPSRHSFPIILLSNPQFRVSARRPGDHVHHMIISDTTLSMEDNQKEKLLKSCLSTSLQKPMERTHYRLKGSNQCLPGHPSIDSTGIFSLFSLYSLAIVMLEFVPEQRKGFNTDITISSCWTPILTLTACITINV